MGYTITEKILMRKAGLSHVEPGDIVIVEPDMVMSHDNTAFIIKKFQKTEVKEVWDKEKIVIIFDHCVPALKEEHSINHTEATNFSRENNIKHYYGADAGVSHQVMIEKGLAKPGNLVMGADSHSTIYGAIGALGIPINRTEMAGIWATGKIWLKVPQTIRINLTGKLRKGVYSKDIILKLLAILGASGAAYMSIEFTGETVKQMSISERLTLGNMAVELGAKAGICEYDEKTAIYLKDKIHSGFSPVFADKDANYKKIIHIDVSRLKPQVACPHTVDNVHPIDAKKGIKITQGYLGSCTNGRIEDLRAAAQILKNRDLKIPLYVYPASKEILKEAAQEGIIKILEDAGAKIMSASCGPCFGVVGPTLKEGESCISSSNRNFCGRMGSSESFVYLASPATVAATCLKGEITDPGRYVNEN